MTDIHPWDAFRAKKHSTGKQPEQPKTPAGMTRNWYELSVPELKSKKERMLNWLFIADRNDPNQKKMWRAIIEVSEVIEVKEAAEEDPFLKMVMEMLCL